MNILDSIVSSQFCKIDPRMTWNQNPVDPSCQLRVLKENCVIFASSRPINHTGCSKWPKVWQYPVRKIKLTFWVCLGINPFRSRPTLHFLALNWKGNCTRTWWYFHVWRNHVTLLLFFRRFPKLVFRSSNCMYACRWPTLMSPADVSIVNHAAVLYVRECE